jgi:hypothetical protein
MIFSCIGLCMYAKRAYKNHVHLLRVLSTLAESVCPSFRVYSLRTRNHICGIHLCRQFMHSSAVLNVSIDLGDFFDDVMQCLRDEADETDTALRRDEASVVIINLSSMQTAVSFPPHLRRGVTRRLLSGSTVVEALTPFLVTSGLALLHH